MIRLIITEGPRFPTLAEFYYHEVIERVSICCAPSCARAAERGELPNDALLEFPQFFVAPALVAHHLERDVRASSRRSTSTRC